jgi:2'-5' RNA ligase
MRLFLAIFPPKEILDSFKQIQMDLKKFDKFLRLTKLTQTHITLRFLGNDVSQKSLEEFLPYIKRHISDLRPFNARIKEIRFGFPGRRIPRILYVSVAKNENLDRFMSNINSTIEKLMLIDIVIDKRPPHYHFTIARSRSNLTRDASGRIRRSLEKVKLWEGFRVKEIVLIKSTLSKEGPEYEDVERFKLRNS